MLFLVIGISNQQIIRTGNNLWYFLVQCSSLTDKENKVQRSNVISQGHSANSWKLESGMLFFHFNSSDWFCFQISLASLGTFLLPYFFYCKSPKPSYSFCLHFTPEQMKACTKQFSERKACHFFNLSPSCCCLRPFSLFIQSWVEKESNYSLPSSH